MQPFIEMDLSVKPHAFHSHFFKAQRLLLEKCIYYQRSIVNKYPVPFHACRRRHRRRWQEEEEEWQYQEEDINNSHNN